MASGYEHRTNRPLRLKADMCGISRGVCFGSKADTPASIRHLIGRDDRELRDLIHAQRVLLAEAGIENSGIFLRPSASEFQKSRSFVTNRSH